MNLFPECLMVRKIEWVTACRVPYKEGKHPSLRRKIKKQEVHNMKITIAFYL